MKTKLIEIVVACFIVVLSAQADVLELKNGKVLNGTYLGGTQQSIRFQAGDKVEVIPKDEALALTFSGSVNTSAGRSTSNSRPSYESSASYSSSVTQVKSVTIPAGTSILVTLVDSIDTRTDKAGQKFRTRLAADLYVGDTLVAKEGSLVYGTLQRSKQAGRIAGTSSVDMGLSEMEINEKLYPIFTTDHIERGKDATKGTLHAVGAGALLGALIDKNDRGRGALKGAAIGTGVALITPGKPVQLSPNTLLEFRLAQPVRINVPR
jgi:hypothetical protein